MQDGSLVDGHGAIRMTAHGDVIVSDVRTPSTIQVTAGGGILDTDDHGQVDLTAEYAHLVSGTSVGEPTNPMEVQLNRLEITAATPTNATQYSLRW